MNFNSRNPMLGGSSDVRDDVASFEIFNVGDDQVSGTTFAPPGTDYAAHNDLSRAINSYTGTAFGGCKPPPVEECVPLDMLQLQDVEMIINRETSNSNTQDFKFNVLKNSSNRSTTHMMINDCLVVMPEKDIPIEVVGARGSHVVKVMLRYSTGPHYDMPVRACKLHEDMNKGYSFHVPILDAGRREDGQGHLSMEVPVSRQDSGNFEFSVVFYCLNSCHKNRGKKQVMILQLCDIDDNLLKEQRIQLRVCRNVNRDSKVKGKEQNARQTEKRSAEEAEEESSKRVKKEMEGGNNGTENQPEGGSTFAPGSLLPFDRDEESCLLQVRLKPSLVPFFIHMIKGMGAQWWFAEEKAGTAAKNPPYGTF